MEASLRSGSFNTDPDRRWGVLPRAVHQLFARLDAEMGQPSGGDDENADKKGRTETGDQQGQL